MNEASLKAKLSKITINKKENKHKPQKYDNYNLNQSNKWITKVNVEEKSKPVIYEKPDYNLTCYGGWLEIKNYDEKATYFRKDKKISNYFNNSNNKLLKLRIYPILFINIFIKTLM